MKIKLPLVVTREHVSSFLDKFGPVVDMGILVAEVKIMQKIDPDVLDASVANFVNTSRENHEMISLNEQNTILKQPHEEKVIKPNIQQASIIRNTQLSEEQLWQKIIPLPSVSVIPGKRGSGKSGLGYRLLEIFRYILNPYFRY